MVDEADEILDDMNSFVKLERRLAEVERQVSDFLYGDHAEQQREIVDLRRTAHHVRISALEMGAWWAMHHRNHPPDFSQSVSICTAQIQTHIAASVERTFRLSSDTEMEADIEPLLARVNETLARFGFPTIGRLVVQGD